MAGDAGRVVVEVLAEHEEAGALGAYAVGEALPEVVRHPGDGVHPECGRALIDPLFVGTDEIVEHRRIVLVEIGQLGQPAAGVVESVQRVAGGVEVLRPQVLVIGDQPALAVPQLAVLRLRHGHGVGRRAMVGDDVQHHVQLPAFHRAGETGEIQAAAGQVFVQPVEIGAPVAVVAGLAAIGEGAVPDHRVAAGEGFVRIVDDGRHPDRGEAHVADVAGIVEDALEVAAQVADVVGFAGRRAGCRQVEAAMRATLIAMIVGGVAVDEPIGEHEVHRFAGEGFGGAVEILRADGSGEQDARHQGRQQHARGKSHQCTCGEKGTDSAAAPCSCTRSSDSAASSRLAPLITSAKMGWLPKNARRTGPSRVAATICGITMNMLKMPM